MKSQGKPALAAAAILSFLAWNVAAWSPQQQQQQASQTCWSPSARAVEDMDAGMLLFDGREFEFSMVSDLDINSRDPEDFIWRSYLRKGRLLAHTNAQDGRKLYRVEWGRTLTLESETAKRNRSMELSELVQFGDRVLAMCDATGLIFKLDTVNPPEGTHPQVFQRWAIADGNGEKVKPCKIEWATVRDNVLYVGSIGKEWSDENGNVIHRDAEWVKTIDQQGRVRNLNWSKIYAALKYASNTTSYLWHEAVHWCPRNRKWYILPRKRSLSDPYDPVTDETKGANILLTASDDFRDISVTTIGPLQPDRGFTALRKVPGSEDHFIALKVREVGDETATWITVFDAKGNMLLDQTADDGVDDDGFLFVDTRKFEGLEFV
ncbi:Soluble calcium-activated nucleotidase 1 [Hondaea fermentalgiana]|uniref:Soluble calcium-activated nucleotidase 1 n=1 Tax=Hondaea fermentalgiana TaxID=2315210 RepID=A0A2R5GZX5_9STRA|nr:Soluble calcium-activated nucleotidase 1 [Hondaea fermentalgiana]|eukprot:GBG34313.1 Soluble calcium-activated nucleotidase 1 [Hondaea fermentalgiana]